MIKQGKKILLGVGVLAALAFGGSALAAAGTTPVKPAVEQTSGVDRDQIQSGDQTTPDAAGNAAGAPRAEGPATEAPDANSEAPGAEAPGPSGESSGSEVANNDGPGGHADEPGNANAGYQFNGQQ